jgi:hypothetical protein
MRRIYRNRIAVGAALIALLPSAATYAHVQSWPIAPHTQTLAGPMNYPGTANTWCPKSFDGTYANSFFVQTVSYVNYGGTCNAQWKYPPAGTLMASITAYGWAGATLLGYVGPLYNTNTNRHVAQATWTPFNPNTCIINAYHQWKYSGGSWATANQYHVHHFCADH